MAYFPFMIDIKDKNCLVVGGGTIAFHKVKVLVDFGVHIRVVAAEICRELQALADRYIEEKQQDKLELEIVQREFQDSDVEGMDFVVAATDDELLNCHISDLCRQKNILINAVDMKEACSFIFPAIIREEDLLIAVSTGGQSPAAAAYVKKQIRNTIPEYYGNMVETLGEYREYILKHVHTAKERKRVFNRLLEYGDAHEGQISPEIVNKIIQEVAG